MDPDTFTISFHPPGNCGGLVLKSHLELATYESLDEFGNPVIYAHIELKANKTSSLLQRATKPTPTAPGNSPGAIPQQQSSLTQEKSSTARNTGSAKAKNKSTKWSVEHFEYIRIGIQDCEKDPLDKAVPREIFLVAEIPKEAHRKKYAITFFKVDTWNIGGVQIGHCEDGDKFDLAKMTGSDHLDPAFVSKPSKKTITPFLYDIADGNVDYQLVNSLSTDSKKKSDKNQEPVELVKAPAIPTYAVHDAEPSILQKYGRASKIAVVVYFKNKINEKDLGLLVNLQAALGHSETYADFENLMLEGDDGFEGGLKKNAVLSQMKHGFRREIWVLPHIKGSSKMYSWTRLSNWKVCD